jgi:hypothetical protein
MTTPNINPVVGKALYLELRNGGYTNQILVTPEGISASGKYVPLATYRRRVSSMSPRKSWTQTCSMLKSEVDPLTNQLVQLAPEHAAATVTDRLAHMKNLLLQLIDGGYTVYRQPLAVEITPKDLDDIYKGKVPYSAMHRVNQSRLAAHFSAELWD